MSIKCLPRGKDPIAEGSAVTAPVLANVSSDMSLTTQAALGFTLWPFPRCLLVIPHSETLAGIWNNLITLKNNFWQSELKQNFFIGLAGFPYQSEMKCSRFPSFGPHPRWGTRPLLKPGRHCLNQRVLNQITIFISLILLDPHTVSSLLPYYIINYSSFCAVWGLLGQGGGREFLYNTKAEEFKSYNWNNKLLWCNI